MLCCVTVQADCRLPQFYELLTLVKYLIIKFGGGGSATPGHPLAMPMRLQGIQTRYSVVSAAHDDGTLPSDECPRYLAKEKMTSTTSLTT